MSKEFFKKGLKIIAGVVFVFAILVAVILIISTNQLREVEKHTEITPSKGGFGIPYFSLRQSAPEAGQYEFDEKYEEPDVIGIKIPRIKKIPSLAGVEESDVKVLLEMDPLKMGGKYSKGYRADFVADYTVKNFREEESKVSFYFPFPPNSGTLYDVALTIDEKEPKGVEYSNTGIVYSDTFTPGEERQIHITYKTHGIGSFYYGLEHDRRVRKLNFTLTVKGAEDVGLSENSLLPTERKKEGGNAILIWNLSKLITNSDIGIELTRIPYRITPSISSLGKIAPFLFLAFLASLLYVKFKEPKHYGIGSLILVGLSFFLFYPFLSFFLSKFEILPSILFSLVPGILISIISFSGMGTKTWKEGFNSGIIYAVIPLIVLQGGFSLATISPYNSMLFLAGSMTLVILWLLFLLGRKKRTEEISPQVVT